MISYKINLSIIFILFTFYTSYSQDSIKVIINSRGVGSVKADRIIFDINITTENENFQLAFDSHKKRVQDMSKILNNFKIPDSLTHFSLFSINRTRSRTDLNDIFRTRQNIKVITDKIERYDSLQIALISNGIFSFSTKFTSTNPDLGRALALKDAIRSAKEQMAQIVDEMGKKTYTILNMEIDKNYNQSTDEVFEFFSAAPRAESFEQIPQWINYIADIKIVFIIND